jgi:hypothetical protein
LTTVLRSSTLSYVYDFGDYWDHRITVDKTLPGDALLELPFCVGGGWRNSGHGRSSFASSTTSPKSCR